MARQSKKSRNTKGVSFPKDSTGRRSTTAVAKRILTQVLNCAGCSAEAAACAAEKNWRFGYSKHFENVALAMASSSDTAIDMAWAGLAEARAVFEFDMLATGDTVPLASVVGTLGSGNVAKGQRTIYTGIITGKKAFQAPQLAVPYGGKTYSGKELVDLARRFVREGQAQASFADSVHEAVVHPEWHDLRGKIFVLIGATSEMGPLNQLLDRGATVVAIARPNSKSKPHKWQKLIAKAENSCGRLVVPLSRRPDQGVNLAAGAGADATAEIPELIHWLCSSEIRGLGDGPLHIYSGIYLDGEGFVRASVAMDAIVDGCTAKREVKPVLLYIDTPSHVHLVPRTASASSKRFRASTGTVQKILYTLGLLKPLRFRRSRESAEREVMVGLANEQGPNYAIAKYLQRWRALVARHSGCLVSITNGPAAKTNSVMHAKTMAFVMNHLHWIPPNVAHEPETVKELMAMIMVRDLQSSHALARPHAKTLHVLDICEENAWHGGMWLSPYEARSIGAWIYLCYYGVRFGLPLLGVLFLTTWMRYY